MKISPLADSEISYTRPSACSSSEGDVCLRARKLRLFALASSGHGATGRRLASRNAWMQTRSRKRARRAIMEEYRESNHGENGWATMGAGNRWLVVAIIVLLGVTVVAF